LYHIDYPSYGPLLIVAVAHATMMMMLVSDESLDPVDRQSVNFVL
jgi:hypothetical protein